MAASSILLTILFIVLGNNLPEEQLVWNEDYRLSWSDFRGEPQENADAVAITASGLSSSLTARTTPTRLVDYTVTITANFYPGKSWYKPERVDEIVLAHEQLHFDITELNARKLKKKIAEYNFTLNIKTELNRLVDAANKDLAIMQELYDSQSNYSMEIDGQKKWQVYVRNELEKLSSYK